MILYEVIKRQINALHMMEGLAGLPTEIQMNHSVLWLGDLRKELFEVEIRANKTDLGWLYSDNSIILYRYDGKIYECSLTTLKELAEQCLKDKVITQNPALNRLIRNQIVGSITGYLSMSLVLDISNEIK